MRIVQLASVVLLIGAAPAEVPIGRFQTWASYRKLPLDFVSAGVTVHVEPLPCPAEPVGDSSCRWEGYNNQASVTVSAPGVAPSTVTTDPAGAYARIAVVRFDRRDARPGVIVESQSGGSGGDMTAQLLVPSGEGYRALLLGRSNRLGVQGEIADFPRDLSGDGRIDLKLQDAAFDSAFGCNACTPRPPRLFAVRGGELVDESRDPALAGVFAADMARVAPTCLSRAPDRNGACAAYVADAARAGRFRAAWRAMLNHYQPDGAPCDAPASAGAGSSCPAGRVAGPRDFPARLRAFLIRTGYLPA